MKYEILKGDYKDIRDPQNPKSKGRIVRLYRIIAMREINNHHRIIKKYEIGGYIQSEANLSQDDDSWVDQGGMVLENAIVKGRSMVRGHAIVYNDATVDGVSLIADHAHVYGNAVLIDSLIYDRVDIYGHTIVESCELRNSSSIYGNCKVYSCNLCNGAMIHGNANVRGGSLKDVSEIRGSSKLRLCHLSGRAIIEEGDHEFESYHEEIDLGVTSGKGEM